MKKFKSTIFCLVVMVMFAIMLKNTLIKADEKTSSKDQLIAKEYFDNDYSGYRYPILPCMSTWPYGNHQKMVDACQIPEGILNNMTTDTLLETVMAYPLFCDVYAYNDRKTGYEIVKYHFNGLSELVKREDKCLCLEKYYEKIKTNPSKKHLDVFFTLLNSTDFADANIVFKEKNEKSTLYRYTGYFEPTSFSYNTVYTPKGYPMSAVEYKVAELWEFSDHTFDWVYSDDFSSDAKIFHNNEFFDDYGIYPDSSPSIKYNCHSYAWYSQTSPFWWINYFNSTGYTSVGMQNVNIGSKLVFFNSYGNNISSLTDYTHSAIILSKIYGPSSIVISFNLKSKWAPYGLYTHTMENCPYYYVDETTYVADRMYYNP